MLRTKVKECEAMLKRKGTDAIAQAIADGIMETLWQKRLCMMQDGGKAGAAYVVFLHTTYIIITSCWFFAFFSRDMIAHVKKRR